MSCEGDQIIILIIRRRVLRLLKGKFLFPWRQRVLPRKGNHKSQKVKAPTIRKQLQQWKRPMWLRRKTPLNRPSSFSPIQHESYLSRLVGSMVPLLHDYYLVHSNSSSFRDRTGMGPSVFSTSSILECLVQGLPLVKRSC